MAMAIEAVALAAFRFHLADVFRQLFEGHVTREYFTIKYSGYPAPRAGGGNYPLAHCNRWRQVF
jgi:hypothetical protein